jgi:hypothetical protein
MLKLTGENMHFLRKTKLIDTWMRVDNFYAVTCKSKIFPFFNLGISANVIDLSNYFSDAKIELC